MNGITLRVILNVPTKFVSITESKSSFFILIINPSLVIPALFTKTSIFPHSSIAVLAIFSQNDDVTLLDSFWQRYSCTVDSSNNLYTFSSNGAQDFYYTQKSYNHTTKTVTETSTFGCNNGTYFQNDKTITQEEYISLVNGINKEPSFYKEKIW